MTNSSEKAANGASTIWIEEYKMLGADIIQRVGLQHHLLGFNLIFLSTIAGYLFNYGLTNGFDQIVKSEVLILSAIAPFVSLIFTWRHIDHDSNIIDKANYIESVISPNINRLFHQDGLLGFGRHLARSRSRRVKSVGLFAWLGNDHVITISYALIFIVYGWLIMCNHVEYAGALKNVYFSFIVLDTILMLITIYMAIKTAFRYRVIVTVD